MNWSTIAIFLSALQDHNPKLPLPPHFTIPLKTLLHTTSSKLILVQIINLASSSLNFHPSNFPIIYGRLFPQRCKDGIKIKIPSTDIRSSSPRNVNIGLCVQEYFNPTLMGRNLCFTYEISDSDEMKYAITHNRNPTGGPGRARVLIFGKPPPNNPARSSSLEKRKNWACSTVPKAGLTSRIGSLSGIAIGSKSSGTWRDNGLL